MARRLETEADYARKRQVDLASYHRKKDDPEWLEKRRAYQREYMRAYNAKNRERVNANHRERARERYAKWKAKAHKALGGCCSDCRINDVRVLQIDHVNGGGRKHRMSVGGVKLFEHVVDHPEEYQLLCANCHMIKTYFTT
jgi:hypothetical protein